MSLLVERLWRVLPDSPYFDSLHSVGLTAGIMLIGGVIAFCMVWAEFKVIQVNHSPQLRPLSWKALVL